MDVEKLIMCLNITIKQDSISKKQSKASLEYNVLRTMVLGINWAHSQYKVKQMNTHETGCVYRLDRMAMKERRNRFCIINRKDCDRNRLRSLEGEVKKY